MSSERRIEVPVLTRVEGEGALHVHIDGTRVADLRLNIFEPPRFFEKFLEGRSWKEIPDMVARICGICPVAYQMSAVHAIETAFGARITPAIRRLRRLYYCGEWMESHSLHIHLLAAPDFLGYSDAMALAQDQPGIVRRGLRLQGLGNAILGMMGGRSVHPVGARVGGFYRAPDQAEAAALLARLRAAAQDAEDLVRWTADLKLPAVARQAPFVSLRHESDYPMNEGAIVSSEGLNISAAEFDAHMVEHQVPHSTALHALINGKPYWVGPLARVNNNLDHLPPRTLRLAEGTGIHWPSTNPYHSIVARALEIHFALHEAVAILEQYTPPDKPFVEIIPRAGVGAWCTEAPRGILWQRYEMDDGGLVKKSRIVPPTSQNQAQMEADLRASVEENLCLHDDELRARLEAGIRNYDPCISCSTHFLNLTLKRT
ncbi:MAG: Ni/Fe hydrogenase subunit alpha [Gammaproteobacteria bacterium]|nr:MAG: Ni/Fe hydrogenase subunit alpha [Gammaproteobacteria bacterium]